ncbi:MAG: DNA mismatch repair protein MutS [Gemmatimonadota bacterium]
MDSDPGAIYAERARRFGAERDHVAARAAWASYARLATFGLALAGGVWAEETRSLLGFAALAAGLVGFAAAVVVHRKLEERAAWSGALADLNALGPARLARRWESLEPRPPATDTVRHAYADDLDVFGEAGLSQILGPVGTPAGRRILEGWLLAPARWRDVEKRQAAVAELAEARDLRDAVAAYGQRAGRVDPAEVEPLLAWAEGGPAAGPGRGVLVLAWAVPASTWLLAGLDLAGVVERAWWAWGLLAAGALTFAGPGARARAAFVRAFSREGLFRGFPELLHAVASAEPRAPALRDLVTGLRVDGVDPARRIGRLGRLMHLSDLRRSAMLYAPIQLMTLWDLHVHAAMERWRDAVGPRLRGWLEAAGEFEALSALATLAHDQPGWAYPQRSDEPVLSARALGHPLLADSERVVNDVAVGPPGTFLHVTGSNMSGKSTLLRAIGLNAVLAQAGGPVCASEMRLPPLDVRTSIRVRDSLARGVSYFMAELERLKAVVDAAAQAEPGQRVLFLLDEILQGTNTAERRIAARRVLDHLLEVGAIGALTTHDLELLEDALEAAGTSVHFQETVLGEGPEAGMTFDYKLRPGIATSTNALALMRLVGLDGPPARGD